MIDLICQRLTVPFPTAADPAVVSADSLGSRWGCPETPKGLRVLGFRVLGFGVWGFRVLGF